MFRKPQDTPPQKEKDQKPAKRRLQIVKLEERIAPNRHGYHGCNKKHPCSYQ